MAIKVRHTFYEPQRYFCLRGQETRPAGQNGRHLFPSAKLTFSPPWLSQDISLFVHEISLSLEISVHKSLSLFNGTSRIRSRSIGSAVHHFKPLTGHRGFADNEWFDLNIHCKNPNPNPYFVYESLICQRQFGGWK